MTWSYALVGRKINGEWCFGIREIYYDHGKKVEGWTENDMSAHGETPEELLSDLSMMLQDSVRGIFIEEGEGEKSTLRLVSRCELVEMGVPLPDRKSDGCDEEE